MEFTVKRKQLKFSVDEKEYFFNKPNMGELEALNELLTQSDGKDVFEVYLNFFDKLGLPKDACKMLDMEDFMSFVKFVIEPNVKKN